VAQDFAPPAADVEQAHARPDVGHGKSITKAARQMLAFRLEVNVITFTGSEEIFFV
jgi:hypothetical protein